jgi:cell division protein FtsQ
LSSDRKSGSSGPSNKRKSVYISTAQRDRARQAARRAGSAPPARSRSRSEDAPRPKSAAQQRAEERRDEREARQAAQRNRIRLRVGLVVAVVFAVILGCTGLYRSALFTVRRVEVVGATHISAERVRLLARVPPDATLLRFPSEEVAVRVAADPWVESVSVTRVFPDGMRIRVTERIPVALVQTRNTSWLIDGQGYVVAQSGSKDATSALPVVKDVPGLDPKAGRRTSSEVLLNAIKILTGVSPSLAATVTAVTAPSIDGTALLTRGRTEIVVGQAVDLEIKDRLVWALMREQGGRVLSIDVRTPERVTWVPRP